MNLFNCRIPSFDAWRGHRHQSSPPVSQSSFSPPPYVVRPGIVFSCEDMPWEVGYVVRHPCLALSYQSGLTRTVRSPAEYQVATRR